MAHFRHTVLFQIHQNSRMWGQVGVEAPLGVERGVTRASLREHEVDEHLQAIRR